MTKLHRLYDEQGQSPWLDNLTRAYLRDGTLARLVGSGVRGVTANPTILARPRAPAWSEESGERNPPQYRAWWRRHAA